MAGTEECLQGKESQKAKYRHVGGERRNIKEITNMQKSDRQRNKTSPA